MSPDNTTIESLKHRIAELETENARLCVLLERAGIDPKQKPKIAEAAPQAEMGHITPPITEDLARRFSMYFWGRTDVFAKRSVNRKTGQTGYYPQCNNFWRRGVCPRAEGQKIQCKDCAGRDWTKLRAEHIMRHLRGEKADGSDVIGVYPLFPDGTCRFLVFDFDDHDAADIADAEAVWEDVRAIYDICKEQDVPVLLERSRSGKGAHVWIFFEKPIEAALARRFGTALLDVGAMSVNMKSFRSYDRMLPMQDQLAGMGALGNLVALPLQGQALRTGNSAFVDVDGSMLPDQWEALFGTRRLGHAEIEGYLRKWGVTGESADEERGKPWDLSGPFHAEDVDGMITIVLADKAYIEATNLRIRLQNQIRRLARFSNPEFFKNQAMGLSNYDSSKFIYIGADEDGYIVLPRGLLETLKERCDSAGITCRIEDKRASGRSLNITFQGELRENQKKAAETMLAHDNGILNAATAFGKTVVGSYLVASRKTSTLILLESSALIEQWQEAMERFLIIDEELPVYQTKTGRTRRRKSLIGLVQGPKDTSTGIIDIAMVGSLCKKGEYHPRLQEYGLVLVDECHHSASATMQDILQHVKARYVYGLTATPTRRDGLEKINYMLLGPIRYRFTSKDRAEEQGIDHLVLPRFTRVVSPHGRETLHINQAYEILRDDKARNDMIIGDVRKCLKEGRTPVVLSRYTEHASSLYEGVKTFAEHAFLLIGKRGKKELARERAAMTEVPSDESMVLVATGQLVGEGFDFPRLDTLILAMPVSGKELVEQYAGRLNRDYKGKQDVLIYDYIDSHIPVFDGMYAKRLRAYKRIGYQLYTEGTEEAVRRRNPGSIFDIDTYGEVFHQDLLEAKKDIVISSPALTWPKVRWLCATVREQQERGLRVTVCTWAPDAYRYGSAEARSAHLEYLREQGIHVELLREYCERFAVIDREIVWYGSIDLLAKEDQEDNIMRVVSPLIAMELLEMTFSGGKTSEYWRAQDGFIK